MPEINTENKSSKINTKNEYFNVTILELKLCVSF